MRHIVPVSGKDSLATALLLHKNNPEQEYELMFNPTGLELPEVFEWLKKVEDYFGKKITVVGRSLRELIVDEYNGFLPSRQSRYCTRQCKIEPMEVYIGDDDCTIYYGIRADEKRIGYQNNRYPNIIPQNPLIDANMGIIDVYILINSVGLKPPTFFWKSVYDEVCNVIGEEKIKTLLTEWQIDILFAWRSRANCDRCFNQRKYEWVGLLEHHPKLFADAKQMEHNGSEYFWCGKNYPLTRIIERRDIIKKARIRAITKAIHTLETTQLTLFNLEEYNAIAESFIDIFKTSTCGLFCGK